MGVALEPAMRSLPAFQLRTPRSEHRPPNRSFLATMSSRSIAFLFLATLLVFQCVFAQSSDEDLDWTDKYQRIARAPKPKFIRFGRAGAKFIRFGRSGANTWEDGYAAPSANELYVKRGAKFIRFGK